MGESGNIPALCSARCRGRPSKTAVWRVATVLALRLMLVHGQLAAAEVYKWKDRDGHLHFGDKPPAAAADTESVTIRSGPPAAANEARQERLRQVLDSYTRDRRAREASRAAALAAAERREQACARAQARKSQAERINVLYERTADGERRALNAAEHRAVVDKARQAVADSCDQP